jgi:acetyl esterase/lipase
VADGAVGCFDGPVPDDFIGDGGLSPQAAARAARAASSHLPLPMPDLHDHAAVAAWRAAVHAAWGEDDLDPPLHRSVVIGDVPCLEAGPADGPILVYAHGGGYVLGSAGVAMPLTGRLGERLHVVSVDYRLAPEHPWPAAIDDIVAVARAIGGATRPFALGGDSAGGGLAVAAARRLLDGDGPAPHALVLLCPHLDHVDGDALSRAYVGAADPADPRVSPGRARPHGLPPTLVQIAAGETLMADAVRFARRARVAGVDVTLDVWDGLWHTWHYHQELPEARRALDEAAAFVTARLG